MNYEIKNNIYLNNEYGKLGVKKLLTTYDDRNEYFRFELTDELGRVQMITIPKTVALLLSLDIQRTAIEEMQE